MSQRPPIQRISSGIDHFDAILHGGLPKGTVTVFAGAPGSGKTTLAKQICFANAAPDNRVVFFQTLSEPTAKTLRYMSQFDFFDAKKVGTSIHFIDLGTILRQDGLTKVAEVMLEHVKSIEPAIVVIDSFRAFEDLTSSADEYRKFTYEIAVRLMAWECSGFLLGEFGPDEIGSGPLFSVIDGLIVLSQEEASGVQQRFVQVVKMRGTNHDRNKHPFAITCRGVEIFAPGIITRQDASLPPLAGEIVRTPSGAKALDKLNPQGFPRGSTILLSGAAGTGKNLLLLEFIFAGAHQFDERGLFVALATTEHEVLANSLNLGWDLAAEVKRGTVEIMAMPRSDILLEETLQTIQEKMVSGKFQRLAIDSISSLMQKVSVPLIAADKFGFLTNLVKSQGALGIFTIDVPYGSCQISRFGVEESLADGVVILTSELEGLKRRRYIEMYKMRYTAHTIGRRGFTIAAKGVVLESPGK